MAAPTQIWRYDRNADANRSHAALEHAFMFSHIRFGGDCNRGNRNNTPLKSGEGRLGKLPTHPSYLIRRKLSAHKNGGKAPFGIPPTLTAKSLPNAPQLKQAL
jgi:hypothetical protein